VQNKLMPTKSTNDVMLICYSCIREIKSLRCVNAHVLFTVFAGLLDDCEDERYPAYQVMPVWLHASPSREGCE